MELERMTRPERRAIQRRRNKIAKRGPNVRDFTVQFSDDLKPIPYITFGELMQLLPTALFRAILKVANEPEGPVIIEKESERPGLFTGDLDIMFTNAKKNARDLLIHRKG